MRQMRSLQQRLVVRQWQVAGVLRLEHLSEHLCY